jgi:Co/Zn/Cd efflux system component
MFIDPVTSFLLSVGILGWVISTCVEAYNIANEQTHRPRCLCAICRDATERRTSSTTTPEARLRGEKRRRYEDL